MLNSNFECFRCSLRRQDKTNFLWLSPAKYSTGCPIGRRKEQEKVLKSSITSLQQDEILIANFRKESNSRTPSPQDHLVFLCVFKKNNDRAVVAGIKGQKSVFSYIVKHQKISRSEKKLHVND